MKIVLPRAYLFVERISMALGTIKLIILSADVVSLFHGTFHTYFTLSVRAEDVDQHHKLVV